MLWEPKWEPSASGLGSFWQANTVFPAAAAAVKRTSNWFLPIFRLNDLWFAFYQVSVDFSQHVAAASD